jgi:hypothetical protein
MTDQYIHPELTSKSLPNDRFAELMSSVLQSGASFRFQASGFSMSPFIRDGDVLTLTHLSERGVCLGAVVAFINPSCQKLAIHRVVGIHGNQYLIKADNSQQLDGWVSEKDILGFVTRVEHLNEPVRIGLGAGHQLIALLSRYNILVPSVRVFLPLLRSFLKGIG